MSLNVIRNAIYMDCYTECYTVCNHQGNKPSVYRGTLISRRSVLGPREILKEQLCFCRHYLSSLVFVDLLRSVYCAEEKTNCGEIELLAVIRYTSKLRMRVYPFRLNVDPSFTIQAFSPSFIIDFLTIKNNYYSNWPMWMSPMKLNAAAWRSSNGLWLTMPTTSCSIRDSARCCVILVQSNALWLMLLYVTFRSIVLYIIQVHIHSSILTWSITNILYYRPTRLN